MLCACCQTRFLNARAQSQGGHDPCAQFDLFGIVAGELHKSNAARKDAELQELRRVVAAKEKSIDSLRTQLATAKGSLEAFTQESEAILQQRDGEVSRTPSCSINTTKAHVIITASMLVSLMT